MTILRPTYCFLLLSIWASLCFAQTPYVFQTQDPIANFAWDENDTTINNGLKHQQTILKNDPNAKVVLKTVE